MRTRSSAAPAPTKNSDRATLQKQSKLLILPIGACEDARFVFLENPRTSARNRYYFCPNLGLFEFTSIAPPTSTPKSILCVEHAGNNTSSDSDSLETCKENQDRVEWSPGGHLIHKNGFTSKVAELLVATPIDVCFFLLPILAASLRSASSRRLFQPLDDILDAQEDGSKHLRNILLDQRFRPKVETRMTAICDTVEAGETMYRMSEEKLVKELLSKAERMATNGLPPSMEERFVRRALELPILSVSRSDTSTTELTDMITSSEDNVPQNGSGSQVSVTTTTSSTTTTVEVVSSASISSTSTPATELSQPSLPNSVYSSTTEIAQLLRIRTALQYIQSSYLPPQISTKVNEILASPSSPKDFSALTDHLNHITKLRAKAIASRSMYDDMTRKRNLDDEDAEAMAEKRRKLEEEEMKKKVKQSRGVRDLKKVDTAGMKKLSSFFGKKA
ncbi:hypothetical protein PRK78_000503 [Emydomyces testavorans]|uniref:Ribonuclease H2 subunit B n=1 Tax=Emydomyces testavorans TaxID=2070801 RepID=A0AAF0IEI5_9EURO|nr:hypothetical protein PRK78_000503 [Emydomyces testavorans]